MWKDGQVWGGEGCPHSAQRKPLERCFEGLEVPIKQECQLEGTENASKSHERGKHVWGKEKARYGCKELGRQALQSP